MFNMYVSPCNAIALRGLATYYLVSSCRTEAMTDFYLFFKEEWKKRLYVFLFQLSIKRGISFDDFFLPFESIRLEKFVKCKKYALTSFFKKYFFFHVYSPSNEKLFFWSEQRLKSTATDWSGCPWWGRELASAAFSVDGGGGAAICGGGGMMAHSVYRVCLVGGGDDEGILFHVERLRRRRVRRGLARHARENRRHIPSLINNDHLTRFFRAAK